MSDLFDDESTAVFVNEDERLVFFAGDITDSSAAKVNEHLYKLASLGTEAVTLSMCSPGGSLWAALAIADAVYDLRDRGIQVVGRVTGQGCSGVIFPLLASDVREATQFSILMIHGMTDVMGGDLRNHEINLKVNKVLTAQHAKLFSQRTTVTEDEWSKLLMDNTPHYYTADEALEINLIDRICRF